MFASCAAPDYPQHVNSEQTNGCIYWKIFKTAHLGQPGTGVRLFPAARTLAWSRLTGDAIAFVGGIQKLPGTGGPGKLQRAGSGGVT
jgi:hypothetical protein